MRTATRLAALTLCAAMLPGCAAASATARNALDQESGVAGSEPPSSRPQIATQQPSLEAQLERAGRQQVVRLVTMCLESRRGAREVYDSHSLHQRCLRWAQAVAAGR